MVVVLPAAIFLHRIENFNRILESNLDDLNISALLLQRFS